MFKKSPLKATRLVQRKRKILLLKIVGVVVLLGLIFWGIVALSRASFLRITEVHVLGNQAVTTQSIQDLVMGDISGNYAGLFSKADILLYPKKKIVSDITNAFPRLMNVSVAQDGMHALKISVSERTAAYTYCTGDPKMPASEKTCYLMDTDGYIFAEAPIFSGNAYFVFYGAVGDTPIRSHYLDKDTFKIIKDLQTMLESLKIHSYAFTAGADGEYDLYINTGTRIIFKADQDETELVGNLKTLLSEATFMKTHEISTIDYIDARYGNKIYYRYIGDNSQKTVQ